MAFPAPAFGWPWSLLRAIDNRGSILGARSAVYIRVVPLRADPWEPNHVTLGQKGTHTPHFAAIWPVLAADDVVQGNGVGDGKGQV